MRISILFLIALAHICNGCGSSPYEFWELSQFKIVPTALADQEVKMVDG